MRDDWQSRPQLYSGSSKRWLDNSAEKTVTRPFLPSKFGSGKSDFCACLNNLAKTNQRQKQRKHIRFTDKDLTP